MPETEVKPDALARASTATTSIQRQQPETFAPRNLAEAIEFAKLLSDSGMVPKDYVGKPHAIVVAIQMGMEVGLQPMQAIQCIAVINGRPAIWGDGALALVKTHPEFEWVREDDLATIRKSGRAVCTIKRRNQPEITMTFSLEDAKQAGLQGKAGPWTNYPNRMLQMRARGFAIRDAFPDALKGILTAEEAMDYEVIEGGPLAEQSRPAEPDPLDQPITAEEAKELWDMSKTNGHVVKLEANKFDLEAYKKALREIGHQAQGEENTAKLTRRYYDDFKKFVSTPAVKPEAKPAEKVEENLDAEPPEEGK